MNEPHITMSGNLAFDPQLRSSATGLPVVTLRVAVTPRIKKENDWEDAETLWFDVICWRRLAENVASSLHRGDAITVQGKLSLRTWIRDDKTEASAMRIEASHVGVDLSRYTATIQKPVKSQAEDGLGDRFAAPVEDELAA